MAAIEQSPDVAETPSPAAAVPRSLTLAESYVDAEQARVESTVARSAVTGAIIGAVICAGIWVGLVAIALVGKGWRLGPMLLVGAGCGVFAGIFLGGWAGTLVGASKLEHHEHATLPGAGGRH